MGVFKNDISKLSTILMQLGGGGPEIKYLCIGIEFLTTRNWHVGCWFVAEEI